MSDLFPAAVDEARREYILTQAMQSPEGRMALAEIMADTVARRLGLRFGAEVMPDGADHGQPWSQIAATATKVGLLEFQDRTKTELMDRCVDQATDGLDWQAGVLSEIAARRGRWIRVTVAIDDQPIDLNLGWVFTLSVHDVVRTMRFLDMEDEH